jgi:hypothetical protein
MRWKWLAILLALHPAARARGEFEVLLGKNSIEVESRAGSQANLPRQAEAIGGDHLHYRLSLEPAAAQVLTPESWLPRASGDSSLHIQCQPGVHYVTSLRPDAPDTFGITRKTLRQRPLFAFGNLQVRQHQIGKSTLTEASVPGGLALSDSQLKHWVGSTARGVADFFGRFPVEHATLLITPLGSGTIQGVTYGEGGPHIWVQIPAGYSIQQIADSWQLCHEMVHLAVPDMPYQQRWLEEGIATYVEPLIRLKLGEIGSRRVWGDMLDGLPKGLSDLKGAGLDGNDSWGATYWGGALFCLMVDVRLRAESHNQHSLQEALRGVVAKGNISQSWTLAQFLDTADRAVHSQVLKQVHAELGQGGGVDLDQLWKKLGVRQSSGRILFMAAPLDFVRQAIAPD